MDKDPLRLRASALDCFVQLPVHLAHSGWLRQPFRHRPAEYSGALRLRFSLTCQPNIPCLPDLAQLWNTPGLSIRPVASG
jgi:hypothetical protein